MTVTFREIIFHGSFKMFTLINAVGKCIFLKCSAYDKQRRDVLQTKNCSDQLEFSNELDVLLLKNV